jgi:WD40 repeat protein
MIPSPSTSSNAVDPQNPWPGLASFTEETRGFFYGRDEEIAELSRRVQRKLLTILFGQSGLGKTSILRAGVVPRLRNEGYCPVYVRIDYGRESPPPSEQIKQAVLRATASAGTWTKPGVSKADETLWEFLHHRDDVLRDAAGRTLMPLIIFDQFEEIFTLAQGDDFGRERAARFKEDLADLVENRAPKALEEKLEKDDTVIERFDFARSDYRLLISLREDYLPHLDTLKGAMPSITQNRMRLARMTGTQALDAVVKPGGSLVTADVSRAIVEFVSGARGGSIERLAEIDVEPPLLSVICRELNERRRTLGQAQITAEMVTGNRREILTDFYERSVGDLPEAIRRFVEDKLLTRSGFRDNLALETALEEPGVTRPLIDTLVSRRLLRIEDRVGSQRVELTHDVLADVVRASRDARQQRIAFEQARQHEARLLAEATRRARRMRFVVGGLAAAVVVLIVAGLFVIRAQRRATHLATQTDLVLASRLLDEGRLADGLAHLVRAGRKNPHNELVAPRLLSALTSHNFSFPLGAPLALPSPTVAAAYSADGKKVAAQGEDGVVRFIDPVDWRVTHQAKFDQRVQRSMIRWSDNLSMNAVVLNNGTIVLFDDQGRIMLPPIRIPDDNRMSNRARSFALSPDGKWVAGSDDVNLWLWDTTTGELRMTVRHSGTMAFSRDSRRIAAFRQSGNANFTTVYSVPDGAQISDPILHASSGGRFFSADGEVVYVGLSTGTQGYDITTRAPTGPLVRLEPGAHRLGVLSPDGKRMVYFGTDAFVMDLDSGERIFPPLRHGAEIRTAIFSADGKRLFTNSADGYFRVWDMETGRSLADPIWRQDRFSPAVISPDGKRVIVFTAEGPAYRMQLGRGAAEPLDLRTGNLSFRTANFLGTDSGRVLVTTVQAAKIVDVRTGRDTAQEIRLPGNQSNLYRPAFETNSAPPYTFFAYSTRAPWRILTLSDKGVTTDTTLEESSTASLFPDGGQRRIALTSTGARQDGIGIWDRQSGKKIVRIGSNGTVAATIATLSPDETRLAFVTLDSAIRIAEVPSGKELRVLLSERQEQITALRFTPDGQNLLAGTEAGAIQVWDVATGKRLRDTVAHRSGVLPRIEFSPDGRHYLTIATDGTTARVWTMATHEAVSTIQVQRAGGSAIAFGQNGAQILAPGGNAMRLWDVRAGLPVTGVMEHGSQITGVILSPDGRFAGSLASVTGAPVNLRLWAIPPAIKSRAVPTWLLELATICAGQRLTDEGRLVSATDDFARLDEIRETIIGSAERDLYAEWAAWFLSDDPNRPVAPGFKIAAAENAQTKSDMERVIALSAQVVALVREERKWTDAEPVSREIVEIRKRLTGPESLAVGNELHRLAAILLHLGRLPEAEAEATKCIQLLEAHSVTTTNLPAARGVLGQSLVRQRRLTEAEPILLLAYDGLKSPEIPSLAQPLLAEAPGDTAAALAEFYTLTNQPAKAAEWQKLAVAAARPSPTAKKQPASKAGKKKAP